MKDGAPDWGFDLDGELEEDLIEDVNGRGGEVFDKVMGWYITRSRGGMGGGRGGI